jgi:hypothetical protein
MSARLKDTGRLSVVTHRIFGLLSWRHDDMAKEELFRNEIDVTRLDVIVGELPQALRYLGELEML